MSLRADGVSVHIGGSRLLHRVDFEAVPGEVAAILGPNGAGKSTLLRVLAGERRAQQGRVTLDGIELHAIPAMQLARRRGVLPQLNHLAFPFRSLEVVLLGRSPHSGRSTRRQDVAVASAAMELTGVLHLADRIFTTLSGGERQRVHLARVLAQVWEDSPDSRVLLLDEPVSALDLAHQHEVLALAQRCAGQGFAVMIVLHDLNLAGRFADKATLLHQGRVVAHGRPGDVLTSENIQSVYGVRTSICRHPEANCPWILTLGRYCGREEGAGERSAPSVF